MKRILLSVLLCVSLIAVSFSQGVKDSSLFMHLVVAKFSGRLTGGDMADRYGPGLSTGLSYLIKTKKNLVFGLEGNFGYGQNIREDILAPLRTPEGGIINKDGNYATIRFSERTWLINASFGKIFRFKKPNPNSGLLLLGGPGYMQHKINIYDPQEKVPQISGDYKKGYDRLSAGFMLHEFVGYVFFSNNRLVNCYAGFEFYQGFTKSMRSYNYDQMKPETGTRLDLIYGFRIGWVLPVYKRNETSYLFSN